ncbi:DUF2778 domain-containing protein [Pandoraea pnomenusa]|uniref:DUF2778 domain-containing protein n=1 Tax=Pandoraea pnomenusa TaxID=93220 RepID=UPI0021D53700|nr:DUF2778 domain-containing protein [Pandoraea pnomenusa]
MALHGKFALNNKDLAPLIIYGLGTYLAFSGNNSFRNRGGCTAVAGAGPIPAGKYWIVDRPSGGVLSRLRQKVATWSSALRVALLIGMNGLHFTAMTERLTIKHG